MNARSLSLILIAQAKDAVLQRRAKQDAEAKLQETRLRAAAQRVWDECLCEFRKDFPVLSEFVVADLPDLSPHWTFASWVVADIHLDIPGHERITTHYVRDCPSGEWSQPENGCRFETCKEYDAVPEEPFYQGLPTVVSHDIGDILLDAEAGFESRQRAIEEGQRWARSRREAQEQRQEIKRAVLSETSERLIAAATDWLVETLTEAGFAVELEEGLPF